MKFLRWLHEGHKHSLYVIRKDYCNRIFSEIPGYFENAPVEPEAGLFMMFWALLNKRMRKDPADQTE